MLSMKQQQSSTLKVEGGSDGFVAAPDCVEETFGRFEIDDVCCVFLSIENMLQHILKLVLIWVLKKIKHSHVCCECNHKHATVMCWNARMQ